MSKKNGKWGIGIAILYVGFILFMFILVAFSSMQDFDLVEKDYYRKEIEYQGQIEKIKRAQENPVKIEWNLSSRFENCVIDFGLTDIGESVRGTIHFFRPADDLKDFVREISIDDMGRQQIDLSGIDKGLWKIKINWEKGGSSYYFEDIFILE